MRGRRVTVDDAHTMTPTLQHSQQDQLEASVTSGRFARQTRTIAWPDSELAPVRSDVVERMRARVQYYDYKIDPLVLAEAIIDRVCLRY
jgi:anti-sigma28 factor (negative regulator of flagellin synthesis)